MVYTSNRPLFVTKRNTSGLRRGGPGRPAGSKNKHTKEMNAFWQGVLEGEEYLQAAYKRVLEGKAPHLESYWLNKVNGKPVERHEVTGQGGGPVTVVHEHHPA